MHAVVVAVHDMAFAPLGIFPAIHVVTGLHPLNPVVKRSLDMLITSHITVLLYSPVSDHALFRLVNPSIIAVSTTNVWDSDILATVEDENVLVVHGRDGLEVAEKRLPIQHKPVLPILWSLL